MPAKKDTPEQVKTHDDFVPVNTDALRLIELIEEQKSINSLQLGVKVTDKRYRPEQQAVEYRDGLEVPQFNEDGTEKIWKEAYFVFIATDAGAAELRVDKDIFDSVTVGRPYVLFAKFVIEAPFGRNKPALQFKVLEFQDIYARVSAGANA